MFSMGRLDWKDTGGGAGWLKHLQRLRTGGLAPLVSGLLNRGADARLPKEDLLKLSEPLRLLRQSGLDLERSSLREEAQQIEFSFSFRDEHVRNLTAGGFLDSRSQTLKMDFSFQASLKTLDPVTGEEREELFRFELHLEAGAFQIRESCREVRKEDILAFARKLLQKISKMQADGRKIDGLMLEGEDLQELSSVDGGKLVKQIGGLIELLRFLRQFTGEKGPHEWLKLERQKCSVAAETSYEALEVNLSLKVSRMEAGVSGGDEQGLNASPSLGPVAGDADAEGTILP